MIVKQEVYVAIVEECYLEASTDMLFSVFCQSVAKRLGEDRLKKSMKKLVKDRITALIEGKKPGNDAVKKAKKPLFVRESVVAVEVVAEKPLVGEFVVGELEEGGKSAVEESIDGPLNAPYCNWRYLMYLRTS